MAAPPPPQDNVRVVIRLRPLSEKERERGGVEAVEIRDNRVLIEGKSWFAFDACYGGGDDATDAAAAQEAVWWDLAPSLAAAPSGTRPRDVFLSYDCHVLEEGGAGSPTLQTSAESVPVSPS